jgi:uncharacterized RDD family membrane protein YckC
MRDVEPDRDIGLQGHYAGISTRLVGFVIDVIAIVLLYDLFVSLVQVLVSTITGHQFRLSELSVLTWVLLILWAVFYCAYPIAAGGRTLGMAVVGLRAVQADGTDVTGHEALIRVLALPLCFLTLGIGFLLILLRRDNRALHDLVAGTAVVYSWDARAARLRFLTRPDDYAVPIANGPKALTQAGTTTESAPS